MAGAGERQYPRRPGVDGGVRRLHSRLSYWEAGAPVERRLLRVRVERWRGTGWLEDTLLLLVRGDPMRYGFSSVDGSRMSLELDSLGCGSRG